MKSILLLVLTFTILSCKTRDSDTQLLGRYSEVEEQLSDLKRTIESSCDGCKFFTVSKSILENAKLPSTFELFKISHLTVKDLYFGNWSFGQDDYNTFRVDVNEPKYFLNPFISYNHFNAAELNVMSRQLSLAKIYFKNQNFSSMNVVTEDDNQKHDKSEKNIYPNTPINTDEINLIGLGLKAKTVVSNSLVSTAPRSFFDSLLNNFSQFSTLSQYFESVTVSQLEVEEARFCSIKNLESGVELKLNVAKLADGDVLSKLLRKLKELAQKAESPGLRLDICSDDSVAKI